MGWRLGGVLGLAIIAAGCSESPKMSMPGMSDWAMAPATTGSIPAVAVPVQADPSFRMTDLKVGLSKADLQAMYPNRLAFDSGDGRNELYFVEPAGVTPRSTVTRDRLVLWLNDGRLASFDVLRSSEPVAVAAVTQPLPEPQYTGALARNTAPHGKYGVQVAAPQSEADARKAIDMLRAKHPKLLVKEWATINRVELPNGVFYRVVVGPYATAQQAERLCTNLKAEGAPCFIRGT
jgi:hypothetical protein